MVEMGANLHAKCRGAGRVWRGGDTEERRQRQFQLICDSAAAVVNITSWAFKLPTTKGPKLDGLR